MGPELFRFGPDPHNSLILVHPCTLLGVKVVANAQDMMMLLLVIAISIRFFLLLKDEILNMKDGFVIRLEYKVTIKKGGLN